jgi:hypothetical protein
MGAKPTQKYNGHCTHHYVPGTQHKVVCAQHNGVCTLHNDNGEFTQHNGVYYNAACINYLMWFIPTINGLVQIPLMVCKLPIN